MAKLPLDLSKFKKISSDKLKAVLKHDQGHEVHIALNALEPKMRAHVARMPIHLAEGGEVHGEPCKNPKCKSVGKVHPNCKCYGGYAKGGEVSHFCKGSKSHDKKCQYFAEGGQVSDLEDIKQNPAFKDVPDAPMFPSASQPSDPYAQLAKFEGKDAAPSEDLKPYAELAQFQAAPQPQEAMPQPEQPVMAAPAQPEPTLAPEQPSAIAQSGMSALPGMSQTMQGLQTEAAAKGALGEKQAAIQDALQPQLQKVAEDFQKVYQDKSKEIERVASELDKGHIDINRYVNSMSTMGKIGTGIGMLIAGLGGGENSVIKNFQANIDRDIDAQKNDRSNKQNLVSIYTKQIGNAKDGAEMAKLVLAGVTISKMQQAEAKAQSPLAKAEMQKAIGSMYGHYAPMMLGASAAQMLSQPQVDPASGGEIIRRLKAVGAKDQADDLQARWVPGVGLAGKPVPESAHTAMIAKQNLLNATHNLREWVAKNGASVDPRVRAEGNALAAELQQAYRQGVGASTSEQEQKIISNEIISSDPAQLIKRWNVDPKLKALQHSMEQSFDVMKRGYGLPTNSSTDHLSAQQMKLVEIARKHPTDPRSQMLLKKLGVQ